METRLPGHLARAYKSLSQQARAVTEPWGAENFYCLNCASPRLERTAHGTKGIDYVCPRCEDTYQLKGQSRPLSGRMADAAYQVMVGLIYEGRAPHLFALHYDRTAWTARNLLLIPRFVFTESAIEKRAPLSPAARRRGHVLCNIVLANLPEDARIPLIVEGKVLAPRTARELYERVRPLQRLKLEARGWTLDVLTTLRRFGKEEFALAEAYGFAGELERLHPRNRHIREKIRQQLQVLRDLGFVEFLGRGRYRMQ